MPTPSTPRSCARTPASVSHGSNSSSRKSEAGNKSGRAILHVLSLGLSSSRSSSSGGGSGNKAHARLASHEGVLKEASRAGKDGGGGGVGTGGPGLAAPDTTNLRADASVNKSARSLDGGQGRTPSLLPPRPLFASFLRVRRGSTESLLQTQQQQQQQQQVSPSMCHGHSMQGSSLHLAQDISNYSQHIEHKAAPYPTTSVFARAPTAAAAAAAGSGAEGARAQHPHTRTAGSVSLSEWDASPFSASPSHPGPYNSNIAAAVPMASMTEDCSNVPQATQRESHGQVAHVVASGGRTSQTPDAPIKSQDNSTSFPLVSFPPFLLLSLALDVVQLVYAYTCVFA